MEIIFTTRDLEKSLIHEREIQRNYGKLAAPLKRRLDILRMAVCLADISHNPPPRRHKLDGDWAGHYAVDIQQNWRLIFKPNHDPVPCLADGGVDLRRVTAIEIVAIKDYH